MERPLVPGGIRGSVLPRQQILETSLRLQFRVEHVYCIYIYIYTSGSVYIQIFVYVHSIHCDIVCYCKHNEKTCIYRRFSILFIQENK